MTTKSKTVSLLPARALAVLMVAGLGCGPVSSIDRASASDAGSTGGSSGSGGSGGAVAATGGASGSAGGAGGQSAGGASGQGSGGAGVGGAGGQVTSQGGAGGQQADVGPNPVPDVRIDEPVQMPADAMIIPPKALLVVGDPAVKTPGDVRLGAMLQARSYVVTYHDDNSSASAAQGMNLVVLSSSAASATLVGKYRDTNLPVLVMESHVFDEMKMTGPTKATDYDEEDDSRISILPGMDTHPLAAYNSGAITVVSNVPASVTPCCGVNWGRPASSAIKVASYGGIASKVAIFAYDKSAVMVDGFAAPARRIGFFAADTAVQYLSVDGLKLFNAAVTWLAEP